MQFLQVYHGKRNRGYGKKANPCLWEDHFFEVVIVNLLNLDDLVEFLRSSDGGRKEYAEHNATSHFRDFYWVGYSLASQAEEFGQEWIKHSQFLLELLDHT